jgi:hypothetical protein
MKVELVQGGYKRDALEATVDGKQLLRKADLQRMVRELRDTRAVSKFGAVVELVEAGRAFGSRTFAATVVLTSRGTGFAPANPLEIRALRAETLVTVGYIAVDSMRAALRTSVADPLGPEAVTQVRPPAPPTPPPPTHPHTHTHTHTHCTHTSHTHTHTRTRTHTHTHTHTGCPSRHRRKQHR